MALSAWTSPELPFSSNGEYKFNMTSDKWGTLSDTEKYKSLHISAPKVFLITHLEKGWDQRLAAREAVESAVADFHNEHLPIVTLLSPIPPYTNHFWLDNPKLSSDYLFKGFDGTIPVPYIGDLHQIRVSASEVLMAGAFFSRCFCNSFRSLIFQSTGIKEIRFLLSGIIGFPENPQLPLELRRRFMKSNAANLKELFENLTDEEVFQSIDKGFFGEDNTGQPACINGVRVSSPRTYKFLIYRENRLIGSSGQGSEVMKLILD